MTAMLQLCEMYEKTNNAITGDKEVLLSWVVKELTRLNQMDQMLNSKPFTGPVSTTMTDEHGRVFRNINGSWVYQGQQQRGVR